MFSSGDSRPASSARSRASKSSTAGGVVPVFGAFPRPPPVNSASMMASSSDDGEG
jgi:hypothetical protein